MIRRFAPSTSTVIERPTSSVSLLTSTLNSVFPTIVSVSAIIFFGHVDRRISWRSTAGRHSSSIVEVARVIVSAKSGDALEVKRALNGPALPLPELAIARQEPIAQHRTNLVVAPALDEVLAMVLEHVAGPVGVDDQMHLAGPEMEADDPPVLDNALGEEAERVPS